MLRNRINPLTLDAADLEPLYGNTVPYRKQTIRIYFPQEIYRLKIEIHDRVFSIEISENEDIDNESNIHEYFYLQVIVGRGRKEWEP